MYVYILSEPGLWTVGFYDPQGNWQSESDHDTREAAAKRVHWMNGGSDLASRVNALEQQLSSLQETIDIPDWRERR